MTFTNNEITKIYQAHPSTKQIQTNPNSPKACEPKWLSTLSITTLLHSERPRGFLTPGDSWAVIVNHHGVLICSSPTRPRPRNCIFSPIFTHLNISSPYLSPSPSSPYLFHSISSLSTSPRNRSGDVRMPTCCLAATTQLLTRCCYDVGAKAMPAQPRPSHPQVALCFKMGDLCISLAHAATKFHFNQPTCRPQTKMMVFAARIATDRPRPAHCQCSKWHHPAWATRFWSGHFTIR